MITDCCYFSPSSFPSMMAGSVILWNGLITAPEILWSLNDPLLCFQNVLGPLLLKTSATAANKSAVESKWCLPESEWAHRSFRLGKGMSKSHQNTITPSSTWASPASCCRLPILSISLPLFCQPFSTMALVVHLPVRTILLGKTIPKAHTCKYCPTSGRPTGGCLFSDICLQVESCLALSWWSFVVELSADKKTQVKKTSKSTTKQV